jgi:sugar O-acyltransferase (sialic acid O-acetyltransferase NeuD family)
MVTALLANGSHGHDIQAIAERCDRYLSIFDEATGPILVRAPVLIGVNHPLGRREVANRWPDPAEPLIDPAAIVGPGVTVGPGCVLAPNAVLLRDVTLGQHVHVNYGASMTRCSIGDFTTICPGVTICGDVEIGEAAFIGAGAVICNLVSIGAEAVIGAGAVVTHDVKQGACVKGVPAR